MSDELLDEIEAINSIYGEESLVRSDDGADATYVLQLPGDESSSLKLRFPDTYPASQPPEVISTHHSSKGERGAGARDLRLFNEALGEVFSPGLVCLFDAMEEFSRKRDDEEAQETPEDQIVSSLEDNREETVDLSALPAPPWTLSEVLVDMKSTFIAHVAPVTSPSQAKLYVEQLLHSDKRIRTATHNITAWRIRGDGSSSYQDCDDDGEDAAGGRLLHLMQLMEIWDAMVVVTRWYGGVKLGPKRFAVINTVARDAFVRAGMVEEKKKGK